MMWILTGEPCQDSYFILELDCGIESMKYIILLNDRDHAQKLAVINRILYFHMRCTTFWHFFYLCICACGYNRKARLLMQNPDNRI
jgi:hypothetical protein